MAAMEGFLSRFTRRLRLGVIQILIAAGFIGFALAGNSPGDMRVFFSPETILHSVVVENLKSATKSIDLSIYTFWSPSIRAELLNAKARGVDVRLVVRKGADSADPTFLIPLFEADIPMVWLNKINHHKFLVIDKQTLLTSSGNFSETPLQMSYDENLVVCARCLEEAAAYSKEFEFLFMNGSPLQPRSLASTAPQFRVANLTPAKVYFTSANFIAKENVKSHRIQLKNRDDITTGEVEAALVRGIAAARSQILIATGHFRSGTLLRALERAVKRGIKVSMVLDGQEYISLARHNADHAEWSECERTASNQQNRLACQRMGYKLSREADLIGVDVRFKAYSLLWSFLQAPQMHHKYLIVDGKKVYTGSYNWSYNAEFNSLENVIAITQPEIVQEFVANFEQVQNYGQGELKSLLLTLTDKDQPLHNVYKVQTLKYPQMDEVRELACRKCPDVFCGRNDESFEEAPVRDVPACPGLNDAPPEGQP